MMSVYFSKFFKITIFLYYTLLYKYFIKIYFSVLDLFHNYLFFTNFFFTIRAINVYLYLNSLFFQKILNGLFYIFYCFDSYIYIILFAVLIDSSYLNSLLSLEYHSNFDFQKYNSKILFKNIKSIQAKNRFKKKMYL